MKCISVQPSSGFHGLEGLKHMPTAIRPGIYDETLADGNLWMETEDAYRMVRRLAREEGLLVGISSGCNVHAATMVARQTGGARRSRHHRHRAVRQRREIPVRTLLGRGMIRIEAQPWQAHGGPRPPAPIRTSAAAPCWAPSTAATKTCAEAIALENAFAGAQAARYELRPEDLLQADKAARERGMDLIGIYHSHPDCDAYFSATDLQEFLPVVFVRGAIDSKGRVRPRQ